MKPKLKVTLILFVLFASLLALNTSITPILANTTENEISACPAEPTCPTEPVCKETCMDVSVVIADAHYVFMGEGVSGTGPLRWEGTVTFADGTVLTWIAYADPAPSFVGPDADWSTFGAGMQGELEIFREEVELKNSCGEIVAIGYEQGIFNITSSEFNVAGELEVCGDAGPLTGKTVDKFYTTGLVWIDDCGAFHAEGRTVYVLCNDSTCPTTCPAPDIVLATSHAVFMGEGVSGTGPLRWEGTITFADGTELIWIAYADPAPYFTGPEADWSSFGGGMQGELEVFTEIVEYKDACGDVVAMGWEQGIFNITSSEFNVAGELEICGDVEPLSGMYVEKFFTTGLVWTDDCGAFHAEGCTLFLLADEPCPETCPTEPVCPEEPVCPATCPEEPECPEEPICQPESAVCLGVCEETSVILVDNHMILMGEPVGGTGPLRWEGTMTFTDGTVLTIISLPDPAPYFTGPDADWSAFGAGIQGELQIFREEFTIKNKCGDVVATGWEQGIFNVTSLEYNVSGELEVCGDAGPLTGKLVEKMFFTGIVWFDDCGRTHAESHGPFLVCDA